MEMSCKKQTDDCKSFGSQLTVFIHTLAVSVSGHEDIASSAWMRFIRASLTGKTPGSSEGSAAQSARALDASQRAVTLVSGHLGKTRTCP